MRSLILAIIGCELLIALLKDKQLKVLSMESSLRYKAYLDIIGVTSGDSAYMNF